MGAFHQRVSGMTTTAVLIEFFCTDWIEINEYMHKKTKKIHPTGKHWVNGGVVPALLVYQLVRAERQVRALIFGCTYLVTSTVLGALLGMPQKSNIVTSKQKHSFLQVRLSASIKLLSETQFYLSILKLYVLAMMDWDGSHFLLNIWIS